MQRELVPAAVQRTSFAYFYKSSIILCGVVDHDPAGNGQMAQDASRILQKICMKTLNIITGLYSTQTNGRLPRKQPVQTSGMRTDSLPSIILHQLCPSNNREYAASPGRVDSESEVFEFWQTKDGKISARNHRLKASTKA
jgi:hypothetical protein